MSDTRFPTRFGKYILLDRINSGGMAEVYRAKVTGVERFERLVAIKCMLPSLADDQQFATMFVDEAKLAAQLNHPNIVQIYELGRIGQRLYIAMELVNGRDLRHVVRTAQRKGVKLPLAFAAYTIAKAADGLDFAHKKRAMDGRPLSLVHRDVSPQNILVSYDGDVKVADFGIAKAEARATETQTGTLKGKFAYMAPEQVAGSDVDRRADIFALGAVLYEVLSGQRLFAGESDLSILDKVSRADTQPVEALLAGGHEPFREVFARALAKDREARFGWASELSESLEPFLIDNRSIFGAKRAAKLMQSLYADEIALLADRTREYAGITDADVAGSPRQGEEHRATRGEQVFETGFTGPAASGSRAVASDWGVDPAGTTAAAVVPGRGAGREPQSDTWDELERTGVVEVSAAKAGAPAPQRAPGRPRLPALVAATVTLVAAAGVAVYVTHDRGPVSRSGRDSPTALAAQEPLPAATSARPETTATPARAGAATGTPRAATRTAAPAAETAATPASASPSGAVAPASVRPALAADARFGFISVVAPGAAARVFVDGEEAGYTPLVGHRVKAGTRSVRVVEIPPGSRERTEEVVVAPTDGKKSPRKVIVRL